MQLVWKVNIRLPHNNEWVTAAQKIISTQNAHNAKVELDILRYLRHNHIVRLKHGRVERGKVLLFLEFCQMNCRYYIDNVLPRVKCQLQVQESITILLCVARGIQWLHHNNIIHRDVKPENMYVFCSMTLV